MEEAGRRNDCKPKLPDSPGVQRRLTDKSLKYFSIMNLRSANCKTLRREYDRDTYIIAYNVGLRYNRDTEEKA